MAAEMVICKNIIRFLENKSMLESMSPLKNLKESVEMAANVMAALHSRNADSGYSEHHFNGQLRKLQALLYEADDLVDKINTFKLNSSSEFSRKVSRFLSTHSTVALPTKTSLLVRKISHQIRELSGQFMFESVDHPQSESEPIQGFRIPENRFIGRESDKKNIINMLLRPKTQITTTVSVIPIVGSPGVGKSTLAKVVYDDVSVESHFDLKIWIRGTEITDEVDIIREIVNSCAYRRSTDFKNLKPGNIPQSRFHDLLRCQSSGTTATLPGCNNESVFISGYRIQRLIEGKLFLLVLDNVSRDSIKYWRRLKDLLSVAARGSHILVTTRFSELAHVSRTENIEAYQLNGLNDKESWSLFKASAFEEERPIRDQIMEQIGKSIARKCEGVPLTIKVAASLLYRKTTEEWLSFHENILSAEPQDIMNKVLHSSYTALPSALKACYVYCSLFPDDFIFTKQDLISLWIAQGYVDQQGGQSLREAAESYFNELSRRCFFEDVNTDEFGNIVTCKMHHIMHILAGQLAAGAVNIHVADLSVNQVLDSTLKHVSFNCDGDSSTKWLSSIIHAQGIRTLLLVKESDCSTKMDRLVCNTLISNFKCLRVLDLHDFWIENLPDSISKLIHLRYLDLSQNGLVTLSKSVTKLYNLETLKLNSCIRLRRIHGNFGQLVNLRRLEVDECDSLSFMPLGLHELTQLETLTRFVVSKNCSAELTALRELVSLRGRLVIELSGDWATNMPEAALKVLQGITHLEEVKISWDKSDSQELSYHELLEQLQPNLNLKNLCIKGYRGKYFPGWAGINLLDCLPKLVAVTIEGCDKCQYLPPFSVLPYLQRLSLTQMANVRYMEQETSRDSPVDGSQEFASTSSTFFPVLEELTLCNFYRLEGWRELTPVLLHDDINMGSFPRLIILRIWNCPSLTHMPSFPNVLDLDLINLNQVVLQNHVSLHSRIKKLRIKRCPNLEKFRVVKMGLGGLPCLKHLVIESCHALNSFTSELISLTSLERLEISRCYELNLTEDEINCDTRSWVSRTIGDLTGLSRAPWRSLQFLHHLTLRELPRMETLPEGMKYVQSLRSLWISACPALTALPEWIGSLTTLHYLRIESCQNLKRLPDGLKDIKSLRKIEIAECPELMERCRKHIGEDWHKIRHAQVKLHKSWRY